jgi:hypothetical protein
MLGLVAFSCVLHSYCGLFSHAYSPLQTSQLLKLCWSLPPYALYHVISKDAYDEQLSNLRQIFTMHSRTTAISIPNCHSSVCFTLCDHWMWIANITFFCRLTVTAEAKQSPNRPGQAQGVPGGWGSKIPRQWAHEGCKFVGRMHWPPLTSRKYSWYSFPLGGARWRGG